MNLKLTPLLCLLAIIAASSGCFTRHDAHTSAPMTTAQTTIDADAAVPAIAPATAPMNNAAFDAKVNQLEKEIEHLRSQLAGHGRGAYAQGPRPITGPTGDETLLDRLYNAETGLQSAQKALDQKNQSIHILQQKSMSNDTRIKSLELKAELYEKNRDTIATLQDNRKVNLKEMQELRASLVDAELGFLKLQRRYFNFSREILELEPGDTQTFLELQDKIKLMTLELKPKELDKNP